MEKFGEFLVRTSKGKINNKQILNALVEQKNFSEYYKKLGEILVGNGVLSEGELKHYLDKFGSNMIQSA